jgi:hypothetical protein
LREKTQLQTEFQNLDTPKKIESCANPTDHSALAANYLANLLAQHRFEGIQRYVSLFFAHKHQRTKKLLGVLGFTVAQGRKPCDKYQAARLRKNPGGLIYSMTQNKFGIHVQILC